MENMELVFICTGNVYRSVIAKYCMKEYLINNKIEGINVDSAGTEGGKYVVFPETINAMKEIGIDITDHVPKKTDFEFLNSKNMVISMALNHKEALEKDFNINSVLFNYACYGKKTSVIDIPEVLPNWKENRERMGEITRQTVKYIKKATPLLYAYIKKH